VTGSFEHFNPRSLALEEVEKRGGRTVSSVTGKTTHLLAGSGAGSKLEAARKLGVAIIDEQKFLSLLEGGVSKREELQGEFSF
jgi:DNA ligase (NAD+)